MSLYPIKRPKNYNYKLLQYTKAGLRGGLLLKYAQEDKKITAIVADGTRNITQLVIKLFVENLLDNLYKYTH